jgi:hypothetical protein
MKFPPKFLIREPDKIGEARRNELICVGDLKPILLKAPLSPSWRAAFLKSSSCATVPIGNPLAAATSSEVKRLLPVTFTAMSL